MRFEREPSATRLNIPEILMPESETSFRVAVARNQSELEGIHTQLNAEGRTDIAQIYVNGKAVVVTTTGMKLYSMREPHKTGSPSDALYLARGSEKNLEILVQYLPPYQRTSHHRHPNAGELYQELDGNLFMLRNRSTVQRLTGRALITRYETHIGFTTDEPAISLVVLMGGDSTHTHVERPHHQTLIKKAQLQGVI
ncbi:MAG: hypothetical protein NUV69_05220 [Candidatus Curtissbacteria bacterium]|nr:hypothetical protein [Candidatus Curtissbacteria bacterium]